MEQLSSDLEMLTTEAEELSDNQNWIPNCPQQIYQCFYCVCCMLMSHYIYMGAILKKKMGFSEPSMKPVFGYIVVPPSQLHWESSSPWKNSTSRPPQQLFSDNTMINLLFLLDTLKNRSFVSVILTDGPPWCQTQTVYSKVILFLSLLSHQQS